MITRKHVFEEIVRLEKFKKLSNEEKIDQLYNSIVVLTKILLSLRDNQRKISRGEKLDSKGKPKKQKKVENPVIKDTDKVVTNNG